MNLFKENPKTKNYSKIKLLLLFLENFLKNLIYFLLIFVNFFTLKRKKNILDLGVYNDTRFINFLFYSIKKDFLLSYDLNFKIISLIRKIGPINFLLFCIPNFRINNKNLKFKFVLDNKNRRVENSIYFNVDYFSHIEILKKNATNIVMPYYLYPRIYNKKYNLLKNLYNQAKIFKIIFSGSNHEEWYSQFQWKHSDQSKMLNRNEIINFVIKEFKTEIFYIKSKKDFKEAKKSQKKIILLLNDKLVKKTSGRLSNFDHLKFVAQSNFFITAPGTGMPLCHHLVESIKFGTIPISSYADLLYPVLDESLCIKFQTLPELYLAIERAILMSNEEIFEKKKKLIHFYNKNLSPESFYQKLSQTNFTKEVIACNDHNSASLYLQKNKFF